MRRLTLAPWILVGTLTFGGVARAGCCDDAWSCIAAVATAGVSCQIQGLIDTVKALNDTVNTLFNDLKTRTADIINDARQAVVLAGTDIKGIREKALADLNDAAAKAHDIANPRYVAVTALAQPAALAKTTNRPATAAAAPKGAVAVQTTKSPVGAANMLAPPPPADPAAMKAAFGQAETYVKDLSQKATLLSKDGSDAEKKALDAVARHVVLANKIALDTALAPLRLLGESLLDLLSHPERIFDPSAQIEADLKRIGDEIPALLDRIGNEVSQEASTDLERARGPAQQLQDQAATALQVADAMQKLSASKTQADLDALNKLLPGVSKQGVKMARGVMLPVGIAGRHELLTSAVARLQVSKMPLIAKHRAAVSNIVSQWAQVKQQAKMQIHLESNATQKANVGLGQLLGKGTKTDLAKRKQRLLEEAKRRFSNDPKTLQKVQQYIEANAR